MKEFTVENMIAAVDYDPTLKGKQKIYDAFRIMSFHGFISLELFEAFAEEWDKRRAAGWK